jgi:hypothetical protein
LAIRTGADGLPLVLFSDAQGLHVGHCNDHLCGTATTVALGTGSAGSLAIGSDGLGIIAYGDKLARCTDLSCSSVTTAALEPIGTVQAVHIGAFGLPIVTGVAGGKIKRAFCNDVSCTTASVFEMDTGASGPVGGVSWASGQDGRPLVSYIETVDSNATIKVFHCPDALCLPPRTLSIASASVMEGAASDSATLTFLATLSEPVPVEVTVDFMTSDGTASGAVDYLPASGTLTFAPGITSRLVSVAVRGDADYEADESLRVVLSNPVNARLGTETATGTIANDDSPPTVRILNAAGVEGNYGSSLLPVTVELSAPSFQEVSVQYATADVSAQAGTDYFAASGTLRIAPGERKATIGLAVKADREREPDEWLTVRLSNPAGAGLAKSNGDVRILDDDSRPWPGADFDGDFKTDILWREAGNARSYVWLMESRGLKARGYTTKDAWSDWQFLAAGDLNGDGRADLLWRNSQTGQLYVWLMDAFQVNDGSGYTASQADLSWKVEGLGDLDGDGRQDIVWRAISGPARGALFVWLMDATRIKDATYLHPIAEDWAIQRIGDFTGDGRADILWRNITPGVPDAGNLYLWVMNGAQVVSGSGYTNSQADFSWRIETTGDLDANGTQDIIWRAVSGPAQGALFVWLMDGRMVRGATYLDPISTDWQIVGTGDFNGDGTADILWRNFGVGAVDRGLLYFWMMNGPRVVAGTGYGVTNADLTWELKAPR